MIVTNERLERGKRKMRQVVGDFADHTPKSIEEIAPDFATYLIEFPFGDVYSRPGLDLKSRELATVAALTALGYALPQLKVHIQGALHVGWTKQEIIEVIIQMSVYAGFPASLNGLQVVKDVCKEGELG